MISLININKITKYQPMKNKTSKNIKRTDFIDEKAVELDRDIDWFYEEFTRYMAIIIVNRIKHSVQTQTVGGKSMKSKYKPLSKSYNKSKPKRTQGKFWINSDYLIKNIKVFKRGSSWNIGYPKIIRHPSGKDVPAHDILVFLEKGTKNGVPARPLITPTLKIVAKNLDGYFWHWVKLMKLQ